MNPLTKTNLHWLFGKVRFTLMLILKVLYNTTEVAKDKNNERKKSFRKKSLHSNVKANDFSTFSSDKFTYAGEEETSLKPNQIFFLFFRLREYMMSIRTVCVVTEPDDDFPPIQPAHLKFD